MEGLLSALDAVQAEHEGMAAEAFNNDGTYKTGINQVRMGHGGRGDEVAPPLAVALSLPTPYSHSRPTALLAPASFSSFDQRSNPFDQRSNPFDQR